MDMPNDWSVLPDHLSLLWSVVADQGQRLREMIPRVAPGLHLVRTRLVRLGEHHGPVEDPSGLKSIKSVRPPGHPADPSPVAFSHSILPTTLI